MSRVSQGELAKLLNVGAHKVHKLVANGTLALDENGQIDLDAATAILKEQGLTKEPDCEVEALDDDDDTAAPMPTSYQRSRARKEHYAAERERIKFERERDLHALRTMPACPHCGKPLR